MRALLAWIGRRLRPAPVEPLSGPQAELARAIVLSDHVVDRFRERAPSAVPSATRASAMLALRRLIAERGKVRDRPPAWARTRRTGAAFFLVIDDRYVIPVATTRPGALARGGMRPYVATTLIARKKRAGAPNR